MQGRAPGRETARDSSGSLPYSRQIRYYRDLVPVLPVVPVPDSGRDCCVLGIFDCPVALWIDTCTLSPLLKDANDCSGTFSSTI